MESLDSLINELNSIVLQAKKVPFSNTEVVVNKADLLDIVTRFRDNYPEIIKESNEIVKERETILAKAAEYANQLMDDAEVNRKKMLDQNELIKKAQEEAKAIMDEAKENYKKLDWQSRSLAYDNLKKVSEEMKKSLANLTENMNRLASNEQN